MTAKKVLSIIIHGSFIACIIALPFAVPTPNYYPDSSIRIMNTFACIGWVAGGILAFLEWKS